MNVRAVLNTRAVVPVDSHRYELLELLGEGGMGRVYRAIHHPSGRVVAVKTLRAEVRDDAARRRLLLDEATVAARLRHPHVVQLLDVGRDPNGAPFLVMELIDGSDLTSWARAWPTWPKIARAFDDALAGLVAAHAAGVVHRDLKPANLLMDADGLVKVADFGVAQALEPLRAIGASRPVGTPDYMAPEQFSATSPGPATDLYAIGVMLFELVSGALPFREASFVRLVARKLFGAPPRPEPRAGLVVPDALPDLIVELLQPDPRARPRFACEVRERLRELSESVSDNVPRAESQPAPRRRDTTGAFAETLASKPSVTAPTPERIPPSQTLIPPTRIATGAPRTGAPSHTTTAPDLPFDLPAAAHVKPGESLVRLREPALVDRERERVVMETSIDETRRDRSSRLVALVGDPGIGKSRIARWGMGHVESHGLMEAIATGYDLSGGETAGGLRRALVRFLGLPAGRTLSTGDEIFPEWRWLVPTGKPAFDPMRLAQWLRESSDSGKPSGDETLGVDEAAQLAHAVLSAASRARPIYLWVDDLGWARDGALELVERLMRSPGDAAVLVVATLRSSTVHHPDVHARLDALLADPRARRVDIEPLEKAARKELLADLASLAPDVLEDAAELSDGSPFLLENLVHDWMVAGALEASAQGMRPRAGRRVADLLVERPLASLVHERVQGFVAGLGDRGAPAYAVLLRAALVGVRFDADVLRAATRPAAQSAVVDEVLDRALLDGLVRAEPDRAYRFDHGLVHEYLLEAIEGRADRAIILRDVARALRATYSTRADTNVRAAQLLYEAGERSEALAALLESVAAFARHGDLKHAGEHLETAKAWVEQQSAGMPHSEAAAERARVLNSEANLRYFEMRYDEALAALEAAITLYQARGDEAATMRARSLEAAILFFQDRLYESERITLECAKWANHDANRSRVGMSAHQLLAELYVLRGDLDSALTHSERARELALAAGETSQIHVTSGNNAELLMVRGDLDRASALIEQSRSLVGERDDALALIDVNDSATRLMVARGDFVRARELLSPRLKEIVARGDTWRATSMYVLEALISLELDPIAEGLAAARRFITAFREVHHDEALTAHNMQRLAAALEARGHDALAKEIRELLELRRAAFRRGFEPRGL